MSWLDIPPLKKLTETAFNEVCQMIQQAVNNINKQNFRSRLNGDDILNDLSVSVKKLKQKQFDVPLLLPASAFSTTNTSGVNVGGLWKFDPANYYGGTWHLAGTIATANAAATATLEIWGAELMGSISTVSTSGVWVKSTALTMPVGAADLVLKLKTSDATYAAFVYNAFLLYVP